MTHRIRAAGAVILSGKRSVQWSTRWCRIVAACGCKATLDLAEPRQGGDTSASSSASSSASTSAEARDMRALLPILLAMPMWAAPALSHPPQAIFIEQQQHPGSSVRDPSVPTRRQVDVPTRSLHRANLSTGENQGRRQRVGRNDRSWPPSSIAATRPRFQLFTSGLAARYTFLIDGDTGKTWQMVTSKVKMPDETEQEINLWQPFQE